MHKTGKGIQLKRAEFKELPRDMQNSILRYVFENEKNEKRHISRQQLSQITDFIIRSDTGRSMYILGHTIVNEREYITWPCSAREKIYYVFNCEENKSAGDQDAGYLYIDIVPDTASFDDQQQKQAFFSPEIRSKTLILRSWEPGDRMTLFGSSATKKVSDILKDKKIRASEKDTYPVLLADNEIIWIPGVKRSNKFPAEKKIKILCG
ncbi:MAG: tRNA lysidine(34) synthetase TilS [Candidatus Marinimicrobia bacterium]|nr:tRNA lysidine(34) synthetase TilS [Candidatus Neomarinimicrobiota bacterium]